MPGDLEEPLPEEEDHPGIGRRTELPVDRQAQDVTVETAAAAQVARPYQDPAAQNLHVIISPSQRVIQEAGENAHTPADLGTSPASQPAVIVTPEWSLWARRM